MKKTFLFLIIGLFICSISKSQTNEFAPIGAKWWYSVFFSTNYEDTIFHITYATIESIADTNISGINCRILEEKLFDTLNNIYSISEYYVYSDSGKVYYLYNGAFSLLYDFTGTDSWYVKGDYCGDSSLIQIDSAEIVVIDGTPLNKLFPEPFPDGCSLRGPIIEKIGALSYLFPYAWGWMDIEPSIVGFRCYSDSLITYSIIDDIICDSIYFTQPGVEIENSLINSIKVYSFNNELFISGSKNNDYTVTIYNILGQSEIEQDFSKDEIINIGDLNMGLKYVVITIEDSHKTFKVLID